VVESGAGLNRHFERLDNGRIPWYALDLPDVVELRRKFFCDSKRRGKLAASVLEVSAQRIRRVAASQHRVTPP
jgi:O-methyltransferase involved in polyketide biosynthesis